MQRSNRIFDIVSEYEPDVIYHAAAHKHVPFMEANPMEAVKNNIFGTKNVAEAADTIWCPALRDGFNRQSSQPTERHGRDKAFCGNDCPKPCEKSTTKFAAVRFGNVLGSRGSVVPLFKNKLPEADP